MTIEFYWSSGSPFAWRAMLGLEIKKLAYESKLLSFSAGELRGAEHLARNPRGKIPVLVDGDTVVRESLAILAYLESKFPEPALFGKSPEATALVWRLVMELENYFTPAMMGAVGPVFFDTADGMEEEMYAEGEKVAKELELYNVRLADSPWLAGESISAADLCLYPMVQFLGRAEGRVKLPFFPVAERFPNISKWQARLEDLPGVDNAYPPHWRE